LSDIAEGDMITSIEPESYRVEEKNDHAVIIENCTGQSHTKTFVSPESERVLLVLSSLDHI